MPYLFKCKSESFSEDDKLVTKGGNIKKLSIFLVLIWLKSAWDSFRNVRKKIFLKTRIANHLDQNGDDKVWNDSNE